MIEKIILKNLVSKEEFIIARQETENFILDYVDWGAIDGSQYTFKFVNQIGVYVANTSLETRPIVITGWIIAGYEALMTNLKKKLNNFVNPQENLQIEYKGKYLVFSPETTIQYSREEEKYCNEVVTKFKIVGTAADPIFKERVEERTISGDYSPLFHFPLIINKTDLQDSADLNKKHPQPTIMFGKKGSSRFLTIANRGAVPVGMVINFKSIGSVVNPSLTNVKTQEFFKLNKTMGNNEEIEVVTIVGIKSVYGKTGSNWENYFRYRDYNSTWLQLDVGDNIFQFDADSGVSSLSIAITFRKGFLEVEECC